MVLLAECFDWHSSKLTGRRALFNVSADPSQTKDLAAQRPATVAKLQDRIEEYGAQGATNLHRLSTFTAGSWQACSGFALGLWADSSDVQLSRRRRRAGHRR